MPPITPPQTRRSDDSPLRRAKTQLTISDLWIALGTAGSPPSPGKKGHSPFRQDRHPSFSVTPDAKHFIDWSFPEHQGGLVEFIMLATGMDARAACERLIDLAKARTAMPLTARTDAPKKRLNLPALRAPTYSEVLQIQRSRALPMTVGIELAIERGLLWCGEVFDAGDHHPAWILTDAARRNAQARRLDGRVWSGIGGAKSKSIPGSSAAWPIGAEALGDAAHVIITEGPPDLLAALTIAWAARGGQLHDLAFVAVTGASQLLHPEAVQQLSSRWVRIAHDNDDAGIAGAQRWAGQLRAAGAIVDGFTVQDMHRSSGEPAKDLNDVVHYINGDGGMPAPLAELATFAERTTP